MGLKKLPNKNEWNRITKDAFRSDERHAFSDKYLKRRNELQREVMLKSHSANPIKRHSTALAAAAAVFLLTIAAAAILFIKPKAENENSSDYYAEVIIHPSSFPDEQQRTESKTETYTSAFSEDDGEQEIIADTDHIEEFAVLYDIVPEGFTQNGEFFSSDGDDMEIIPGMLCVADEKDFNDMIAELSDEKICIESYEIVGDAADHSAMMVYRFVERHYEPDKPVYATSVVRFRGSELYMFITNTVNIDELVIHDFIAGIRLVPNYNVNKTGEEFRCSSDDDRVTACVCDVYTQDDFSGILTDATGVPLDYTQFTNNDGTIDIEKLGLDTSLNWKLLVAEVRYRNVLDSTAEQPVDYKLCGIKRGKLFDYAALGGFRSSFGEGFISFDVVQGSKGRGNSLIIPPGQTACVRTAILVPDYIFDDELFLAFDFIADNGSELGRPSEYCVDLNK